jgi:peptide/nickel transport system substrate-binding protein
MSEDAHNEKLNTLTGEAKAGRISRRRFMEGAATLGLTVAVASSLWSKSAKAEPKKGGRFRCALDDGNTTDSMDPATYESTFQITMSHSHRNYLTEITPDGA